MKLQKRQSNSPKDRQIDEKIVKFSKDSQIAEKTVKQSNDGQIAKRQSISWVKKPKESKIAYKDSQIAGKTDQNHSSVILVWF